MLKKISLFLLVLSSLACMQTMAASSSSPAPGSPTATERALTAPKPTPTESAGSCKVIAQEALNLRSGPGVSFGVIGWLSPGELLTLTYTPAQGSWIEVITETGAKGWINSNYCKR